MLKYFFYMGSMSWNEKCLILMDGQKKKNLCPLIVDKQSTILLRFHFFINVNDILFDINMLNETGHIK